MGEVYEGRHRVLGRRVAVKFLLAEYAVHPEVSARFDNEARAAGGLEHENIAGVHDVGALPNGTKYLVMEFLDGEDVDHLVQRDAPLPIARAVFIVIQASRGLDLVHARGIVHRDLKPSNLFLAKRGDKTDLVKVIDFGIAKNASSASQSGTKTGAVIGTAHYMSPEQARGERGVDCRTDVYALGVILYELLSGRKPHEGDSFLQILHKIMTDQPPVDLESVRPGLPPGLYDVVRKAMAPSAAQRFQTVADFGDALLPYVGRPLPTIRSRPGLGFAAPSIVVGETATGETRAPSAPGASAPPGSVVGVVRTDPATSRAAGPRLGTAILAAAVLAAVAVAAVSIMSLTRGHGTENAASSPPSIASSAGIAAPAATPMIGAPIPVVAAEAPPTASESLPPPAPIIPARPDGHRTPSGQSPKPVTGAVVSGAAPAPTFAATGPATPALSAAPNPPPAPPSPPAAAPKPIDRSSNPF
jgi:tRNA A-37 threonylcarbamoyl transferase component Bud32